MIIDTHCHLDDERYDDDIDDVLARASQAGVEIIIIPGADPRHLPRAQALSETHERLYFAVGVHPYHAQDYDKALLERLISHPKCVAVGECGLDYYRLSDDPEIALADVARQKEIFCDQIALAKRYKKPLIVHIRDASRDSKEILLAHGAEEVGGVLHCYNADEELLSLAMQGFYFGIGGVVTFSNAKKLINVFPKIPREKLILETDAPYLTPHPHRGTRNEPAYTTLVAEKVAMLWDTQVTDVAHLTTQNACRLFGFVS